MQMVEMLAGRRRGQVLPAFMQLAEPSLQQSVEKAVAEGAGEIVVQPCFLFAGNHIQDDIPDMLRQLAQRHLNVTFRLGRAFGPDPRLVEMLLEAADEAETFGKRWDDVG